jgi:hypothetical protein
MSELSLTPKDRVIAMLEEGKISREEADQLLEALGDVSEVETTLKAVDEEVRDTAARANSEPAEIGQPENVRFREADVVTKSSSKSELKELNWVRVEMLAGDLDIKVDASLSEPKITNGKASFEKNANIYTIRRSKAKTNNSGDPLKDFGNMVAGFISGLHGDLEISIPEGFGVEVNSKAGDVDIEGAAFLKANLLAGDLDAQNIGGVDLHMAAGDVDLSLKLLEGNHTIKLAAGDIDVRILPGSSVTVEGSVSMGDFKLRAPESIEPSLEINKTMMGGDFKAILGGGAAHLDIDLSTGDIEVNIAHD